MKRVLITAMFGMVLKTASAQVGIGTTTPDPSAQLEIRSINKGLLIPRVASTGSITSPANGLLVYQTNAPAGFYYYNGSAWQTMAGNVWQLGGNTGTTASNYIGTNDAQPLRFKANGVNSGLLEFDATKGSTFIGFQSGLNTTGNYNSAFGYNSLRSNISGGKNTAIGYEALLNSNGADNTAVGYNSLKANINGIRNTAIGSLALQSNTLSDNTAIGSSALELNTSTQNTALGSLSLKASISGSGNTAVGFSSGLLQTSGNSNTAVGGFALAYLPGGNNNTAIGYESGPPSGWSTSLTNTTAIGFNSKVTQSNTLILGGTGANAVQVGVGNSAPHASAIMEITSADKGILIPRVTQTSVIASPANGLLVYQTNAPAGFYYYDGSAWNGFAGWGLNGNAGTTASSFIGTTDLQPLNFRVNNQRAGYMDHLAAKANTSYGYQSYATTNNGVGNSAFGYQALQAITNLGTYNVANGYLALSGNTSGQENTAVGAEALSTLQTGRMNTAVGRFALYNTRVNENTAVGYSALGNNTFGTQNVAIGPYTLNNNFVGGMNVAVGYNAGTSADAISNTTIIGNLARAGGSGAVSIGNNATVSGSCVGIGNNVQMAGNNSVAIGNGVQVNGNNSVAIGGFGTSVGVDNLIQLGNGSVSQVRATSFFATSDGRFKFNIQENVKGLSFIMKLRPVTYQFDGKKLDAFSHGGAGFASFDETMEKNYQETMTVRRTGLIAQEVEKAAYETNYDFDGVNKPKATTDHYSVSYSTLVVPLIKAVQEQQHMIQELQNEKELLLKQIEEIKQKEKTNSDRLSTLEALIKSK